MANYDDVINILNNYSGELKKNDFETILIRAGWRWAGLIYDFFLNELGINILTYMKTIPSGAFSASTARAIVVPENIEKIEGGAFSNNTTVEINVNSSKLTLDSQAFCNVRALEKVTIADGVKRIPKACFEACPNLKLVVLPGSVVDIAKGAFDTENEDLIIVVPYKDADRLRVAKNDIPWFKQHLRHRHAPKQIANDIQPEGEETI